MHFSKKGQEESGVYKIHLFTYGQQESKVAFYSTNLTFEENLKDFLLSDRKIGKLSHETLMNYTLIFRQEGEFIDLKNDIP